MKNGRDEKRKKEKETAMSSYSETSSIWNPGVSGTTCPKATRAKEKKNKNRIIDAKDNLLLGCKDTKKKKKKNFWEKGPKKRKGKEVSVGG